MKRAGTPVRRRAAALAAVACMLVGAAGCGSRTEEDLPRGDDIVIGASLELTGVGAAVGVVQERALRIAVETVNETAVIYGGQRHHLKLIVHDNASDAATAGVDVEDLITKEHAVAIIGGGTATTSLTMAPVAESFGIPMISLSDVEKVTQPVTKRRFVFTLGPTATDVTDVMFHSIMAAGVTRIAVLAQAGPHGDAGLAAVNTAAITKAVTVVARERFAESGVDLATRVGRVVEGNPQAVIVWAVTGDPGKIAQTLRGTGYRGRILFDSGAGAEAAISSASRAAADGAEMVHPAALSGSQIAVTTPSGFAQQDFFFRYTRLYGVFSGYAPYGSDAVTLIAEAIRRAGGTEGTGVRDQLESTSYEGIAGAYAFSRTRHSGSEKDALAMFVVQRGNWIRAS